MDTHQDWINQLGASRAEADARMAALTDAEIRADDRIAALTEAQSRAGARSAEADARVAALTEGQRLADARAAEADARIAEIAEAHKKLTEAHRYTEEVVSRLGVKVDALVEAVRGRGGGGAG